MIVFAVVFLYTFVVLSIVLKKLDFEFFLRFASALVRTMYWYGSLHYCYLFKYSMVLSKLVKA